MAHLAYQLVSGGLGGLREVEIDSPVDVIVLLQSSSVKDLEAILLKIRNF